MIPSLEGRPTKAKEAPSPNEVRLAPLDTNPVFQSLVDIPNKFPIFCDPFFYVTVQKFRMLVMLHCYKQ